MKLTVFGRNNKKYSNKSIILNSSWCYIKKKPKQGTEFQWVNLGRWSGRHIEKKVKKISKRNSRMSHRISMRRIELAQR